MRTEKATTWNDLPHEFAVSDKSRCLCGRELSDELHDFVITERAAQQPAFTTEKGS